MSEQKAYLASENIGLDDSRSQTLAEQSTDPLRKKRIGTASGTKSQGPDRVETEC